MKTQNKMVMRKNELVELGYPRQMLIEISHMTGAKSPIWSGKGKGAGLVFRMNFLDQDIDRWQKLNK